MNSNKTLHSSREQRRLTPQKRDSSTTTSSRSGETTNSVITASQKKDSGPLDSVRRRLRLAWTNKKGHTISGVALLGLTIGLASMLLLHRDETVSNIPETTDPSETVENVEYQTVLPQSKSISELGGWRRISPPNTAPVFAYSDTIGDVPITVSQQPLPDSLKNGSDAQVAELAEKFNATTKIDAGGTPIYIGTSAKGPQSVILTKNGLLILIKSQSKIEYDAWAKYAASLD